MTLPRRPGLARRLASFVWRSAARRIDAQAWLGGWRETEPRAPTTIAKVTVLGRSDGVAISVDGTPISPVPLPHVVGYVDELASRLLAANGPDDARSVKRVRTALRRLRAFVRETAVDDAAADHDRGLRRAGKRLGAVRDLDVLLAGLAARRASSGSDLERAALDELEGRLRRDREPAIARANRRLDPPALRDVVLGVRGYVARIDVDDAMAQRWWATTRAELFAALAAAPRTDDDLEALHRIRIAARRARYGVESFGPDAPSDASAWAEDTLALQRAIGSHRDAALLHDRLRAEVERATKRGRITLVRGLEASVIAARSDRARTFAAAQDAIAKARARPGSVQPQLRGSEAARSPTRSPPGRSGRE